MTVDKEAILRKHVSTITFGKLIGTPMAQVFEAMDEYAASLLKENEELKDKLEKLETDISYWESEATDYKEGCERKDKELAAIQSSNEAKDSEIAELKASCKEAVNDYWKQNEQLEYWKARCEAAEKILSARLSTKELNGYDKWQQLKQ